MSRISKSTYCKRRLKRTLRITGIAALAVLLSGCMASASTANLLSDAEAAAYAASTVVNVDVTESPESETDKIHANVETTDNALTEAYSELAWSEIETEGSYVLRTPELPSASPGTDADASPSFAAAVTPSPTPSPTSSPVPTPSPTPSPTKGYTIDEYKEYLAAYLNAGSANMRKGPGTDYGIIMELKVYDEFLVTGESGDWYRIKIDDERGYVLKEFVELGSAPTPTPKATATPKPTATAKPTATQSQSSSSSSGSGVVASDYFSDANGYTAEELLLIAQVVYEEARGATSEGYAAVANIIYNRIISSRFPNTVNGVIFQKSQFTVADDDIYGVKPASGAVAGVKQIFISGDTLLPDSVMYFRSSSKGTSWSGFTYYTTIGGNSFFYR